MSTKDTLISAGLLAAGGVAIAAAAGVYSRGSRAIGDSVRVGADNVVPWTAEQMYDADLVRLSVPPALMARDGGHYEVVVADVVPADRIKGSRATTWEPKGDDFRRADVAYPDEVEVLYVSELRMYLPYVKCAGHVLSFDAALPLARAKSEASQAYDAQRNHNDYVGRNPYPKSRSKS
jgi:hypothetical protein